MDALEGMVKMDGLEGNITSTCPLAFGGITGSLFLKSVMAVVAAHCSILDDFNWPRDNAEDIIKNRFGLAYDFIIVGAGTAGSLLASHISNIYPTWSILLIEAGDDPGIDSEIPAFLFLNQNSSYDWSYKTQPDGNSCLGFKNSSCIWSKGKALGGSSSINAMIYLRGHSKDFSDWENSGNSGWGYNDLVHYFQKQEELFNITDKTFPGYENEWYAVLDSAFKELGFSLNSYNNHEAAIGTKKARLLIEYGKRMNTAKMYLKNARNISMMKNAEVQKVVLNKKSNKASGVQIRHKSGSILEIAVNKEVVLSAGSIATPQILMLSGIGPRPHLQKMDIDCFLDLPVGKNLQDHMIFPLFLKTNVNRTLSHEVINMLLLQYMLTKTGPFSNIGLTDYMSFIDTNNTNYPDIQFHYTFFVRNDRFVLRPYLEGIGYNYEIIQAIEALNYQHDLLGIYPTLLLPKSRGEILLTAAGLSKPIIKANYLQHSDDIDTFMRAINFVHELEETKAFKTLGIELLNLKINNCLKYLFNSNAYWECYIRHMGTTIYHPIGTAKMGLEDDISSVVSNKLLVHGISNLRVVDASIIPIIPRGNTMAATLVVAQKAADIIKQQYDSKVEL